MLRKGKYASFYDYSGGSNCYDPGHLIEDNECYARRDSYNGTLNVVWNGRITRRDGTLKVNDTSRGAKCVDGIRMYRSTTPQRTTFLAIEETSDVGVYFLDTGDTLAAIDTSTGGTEFSTASEVDFAKWKDTLYIAASSTVVQKLTYSGSWARANITGLTSHPSLIHQHKDRLFVAGGNLAEGYVECCDYDDDTSWAAGNGEAFNVGYQDGDPVTRLMSLGDDLVVFKHDSIWVLQGDNLTNWFQDRADDSIGCVAKKSAANVPNGGIVFLGADNIYVFTGNKDPVAIGDNVKPWLDLIPASMRDKAAACYYDGFYRLAFASSSMTTKNDLELWLDVKRLARTGKPAWWLMSGRNVAGWIPCDGPDEGSEYGLYYADANAGYLQRTETGTRDNGVNISAEFHSKFYTFDNPNQNKMYGTFKLDTGLGFGTLDFELLRDLDEGYSLQRTLDASGSAGTWGSVTLGTTLMTAQGGARKSHTVAVPSDLDGAALSWSVKHAANYDNVVLYGASFDWKYKAF